jgi:hypothetical protein
MVDLISIKVFKDKSNSTFHVQASYIGQFGQLRHSEGDFSVAAL